MQEIQLKDEAGQRLGEMMDGFAAFRREQLHKAGEEALAAVRENIPALVDDGGYLVRSWQWARFGTGGGYAAVQPRPKETYLRPGSRGTPQALGALTNYLESGHEKVLWGRRSGGRVRAFPFYKNSEKAAGEIGKRLAGEFDRWFEERGK